MPEPSPFDIRVACEGWEAAFDGDLDAFAVKVLTAAARGRKPFGATSVLFTDDAEMHALNRTWRAKEAPTNVLSFPAPDGFGVLGDIALGYETVAEEARAQGKSLADHVAHMLVHGYLHLLNFDHQTDADAEAMEAEERAILAALGVADPYVSVD